jgi:hypothetical protein
MKVVLIFDLFIPFRVFHVLILGKFEFLGSYRWFAKLSFFGRSDILDSGIDRRLLGSFNISWPHFLVAILQPKGLIVH